MLPLTGTTILDLSQLLPGPFCTWILAEFGADVLKVEPLGGEGGHRVTPAAENSSSYFYLGLNRGKRTLALNLKDPRGKKIFEKLARQADVLVEGFRPGVMARLGLGWKHLRKLNSRLVYCAISGYGQDGPTRHRVGHDLNYLALSGFLGLQLETGAVCVPPVQIADIGAGALPAALGICLALLLRDRKGRGSMVDISMLDALVSWLAPFSGKLRQPWVRNGFLRGESACYNVYPTRDKRHISIGCVEPKFWAGLCRALGKDEWIALQFAPEPAQSNLRKGMEAIFRQRSAKQWEQFLSQHETCMEIVLLPEEMEMLPQVQARGTVYEEEHPREGALRGVRPPVRIAGCNQ
jgi:crotonobetainyl-CoA:carnitine CoA-transferase CaiB-like acyl-CoA transferase